MVKIERLPGVAEDGQLPQQKLVTVWKLNFENSLTAGKMEDTHTQYLVILLLDIYLEKYKHIHESI